MPIKLFSLLLLLASTVCNAQVIKGTWTGNYAQNIFESVSKLVIELRITKDSIITGESHLYYPNNGYELHKIEGRFRKKDSTVYFEETLEASSSRAAAPVIYYMKLSDQGTEWRLQGFWKWKTNRDEGYQKSNSVWLVKPKTTIAKTPKPQAPPRSKVIENKKVFVRKPPVKPKQPEVAKTTQPVPLPKTNGISDRVEKTNQQQVPEIKTSKPIIPTPNDKRLKKTSEVQSTIVVKADEKDSIDIAIYDNGEIDNDSITVYFNNRLLKQQFRISAVPYSFHISLQPGGANEIKIIAENMGSIPPNTALMIVTTKRKRYEVRLSSNLEKNAVVRFLVE